MSDTPRTDAAVSGIPAQMDIRVKTNNLEDLCRQLEREIVALACVLSEAKADAESWRDQCSQRVKDWDKMRERAEAAEVKYERLKDAIVIASALKD